MSRKIPIKSQRFYVPYFNFVGQSHSFVWYGTLPLIGARATISVICLSRNLMPCHVGGKGETRIGECAGFHGSVTCRARTRRKVEGSRPARQEIGFVCEILRAESTSLTLRHLSHTGLPSPAGSELVAIGWFGSLQRRHYSRASYPGRLFTDWLSYNRQTTFNNPSRRFSFRIISFAAQIRIMPGKENEIATKRPASPRFKSHREKNGNNIIKFHTL